MPFTRLVLPLALMLTGYITELAAEPTADADNALLFMIADRILVDGEDRLVASGNVEMLVGNTRLWAEAITYDRTGDHVTVDGPVRIEDADGNILTARHAQLDPRLEDGILQGARVVLDRQIQITAVQVDRNAGRFTHFSRVMATSCQICADDEVPFWQISAGRAVHDQQARQIYYYGARLHVVGLPILYLPRLRMPDPTLTRARGFLVPDTRASTLLGVGIRIPYFIPMGDHADVTLAPYLSPRTRTLEYRYRHALRRGSIQANGALSRDALIPGYDRWYVIGMGEFSMPRGYTISLGVEAVSDRGYPAEYGYSEDDRLESSLELARTRSSDSFQASITQISSLRSDLHPPGVTEFGNEKLPVNLIDARQEWRWHPETLGGQVRTSLAAHGHARHLSRRRNTNAKTSDKGDGYARLQRRSSRINGALTWSDRWTFGPGLRGSSVVGVQFDRFQITEDGNQSNHAQSEMHLFPRTAFELRWPLTRDTIAGTHQMIEPVGQIVWGGGRKIGVVNEESNHVEFDEGNLLGLTKFPAPDRRLRGLSAALGVRWSMRNPSGVNANLAAGRVWFKQPHADLSRSSGLDGSLSDLLLAGQLQLSPRFSLSARGQFASWRDVTKAEARATWQHSLLQLSASYALLDADSSEDREVDIREWSVDSDYKLNDRWTFSTNWRYDLDADDFANAGAGLRFVSECAEVNLSVKRRFTASGSARAATELGLTVSFTGFGSTGSPTEYGNCRAGT